MQADEVKMLVDQKDIMIAILGAGATVAGFGLAILGAIATVTIAFLPADFVRTASSTPAQKDRPKRFFLILIALFALGACAMFGFALLATVASFLWLITRAATSPGQDPFHDIVASGAYPTALVAFGFTIGLLATIAIIGVTIVIVRFTSIGFASLWDYVRKALRRRRRGTSGQEITS